MTEPDASCDSSDQIIILAKRRSHNCTRGKRAPRGMALLLQTSPRRKHCANWQAEPLELWLAEPTRAVAFLASSRLGVGFPGARRSDFDQALDLTVDWYKEQLQGAYMRP